MSHPFKTSLYSFYLYYSLPPAVQFHLPVPVPEPDEGCPLPDPLDHTVLLPHPTDCSSFYSCSNGKKIEMHCPAGLHFNNQLKVCDWPENAKCVRGKLSSLCLSLDFVNFSNNDSINQSSTEILRTLLDQFKQKLISEILMNIFQLLKSSFAV
jgi:hypothetical protein